MEISKLIRLNDNYNNLFYKNFIENSFKQVNKIINNNNLLNNKVFNEDKNIKNKLE